jgi:hypothetical protein
MKCVLCKEYVEAGASVHFETLDAGQVKVPYIKLKKPDKTKKNICADCLFKLQSPVEKFVNDNTVKYTKE